MRKKDSILKWIILLLLPLIAVGYVTYRKIHTTVYVNPSRVQPLSTPMQESEQLDDSKNDFFDYATLDDQEHEDNDDELETQEPQEELPVEKPQAPVLVQPKVVQKIVEYPEEEEPTPAQEQSVKKPVENTKKDIKLTTQMGKKTLGYKHWTGRYYPSKWILKLNNTTVLTFDGKQFSPLKNNISIDPSKPLKARFDFEFLGGRRKGWKEVTYKINEGTSSLKIDFDWKDPKDDQIILSPAKAVSHQGNHNHKGKQ